MTETVERTKRKPLSWRFWGWSYLAFATIGMVAHAFGWLQPDLGGLSMLAFMGLVSFGFADVLYAIKNPE